MGYGARAMSILQSYYQGDIQNLVEGEDGGQGENGTTSATNVDEEVFIYIYIFSSILIINIVIIITFLFSMLFL